VSGGGSIVGKVGIGTEFKVGVGGGGSELIVFVGPIGSGTELRVGVGGGRLSVTLIDVGLSGTLIDGPDPGGGAGPVHISPMGQHPMISLLPRKQKVIG